MIEIYTLIKLAAYTLFAVIKKQCKKLKRLRSPLLEIDYYSSWHKRLERMKMLL